MNDTDTFGSFLSSFLASFRDEYLKLPSLAFPLMAGVVSQPPDCDDVSLINLTPLLLLTPHTIQTPSLRCFINDALYLRTLNEFSTINVPVQPPSAWCNLLKDSLKFPVGSIIFSQIETDTLLSPPARITNPLFYPLTSKPVHFLFGMIFYLCVYIGINKI